MKLTIQENPAFLKVGPVGDTLGLIAAKNHRNGALNPYAQLRKDLGAEFCQTVSEKNPVVAEPLRRTDCSPVSDGAAAVVLSAQPTPGAATAPVRLAGFGHANDFLPAAKRDPLDFGGSVAAWRRAMAMAGTGLDDLDLAEVHDCFTIAELVLYEVMGMVPRGEGRRAIEEGWVERGGRLPVNLSGGLKAKGHPVGATGVSQHVLAAMQLSMERASEVRKQLIEGYKVDDKRVDTIGRGWEEPAGSDSDKNRRVEVYWYTLE
jgi:acetyl-CoA C-acetyltransferase